MRICSRLVAAALLPCCLIGFARRTAAATDPSGPKTGASQAQAGPKLLGRPRIVVDCANGAGRTSLSFHNDTTQPLKALLVAAPPVRAGDAKAADFAVTFAGENDRGAGQPAIDLVLPPGATVAAQAVVSSALDPGQFEADLMADDTRIGKVEVLTCPLNVKLDAADPNGVKLDLLDGTAASIYLKNDDPRSYALSYRLLVGGRQVAGRDFTIGSNGSVMLELVPAAHPAWMHPQWYLALFQDLFKPATAGGDGVLLLYLQQASQPPGFSAPVKRFPIKASLNYLAPGSRDALSYLVIIIVVTLGGLMSLVLHHFLPNQLKKLNIKEQLNGLARATAQLSSQVGSRLGVAVRLERSRLADLLKSRSSISPDFDGVVTQCQQGAASLSARVAMLQQMDLAMRQLGDLVPRGVPPSQIDQIEASLDKAVVFLGKDQPTDADLQAAQAAITEVASGVSSLGRPDDAFGRALAQRVHELMSEIESSLARPGFAQAFERVTQSVPGPYQVLGAVAPDAAMIAASLCTSVDLAAAKLAVIREYALLAEGSANPEMQARLRQWEPRLVGYLQLATAEALASARLVWREMKGDVYPERLKEALVAQPLEASIAMDPPVAYEGQPLTLRVRFHSQALDTAAAREEFHCEWDFGDGLAESGWSVAHYFLLPPPKPLRLRQSKEFPVTVTFQDAGGRQVVDPASGQPVRMSRGITVLPTKLSRLLGERTLAEAIRLAAALLIAVFGLVAGARDQLQKLDVLPGLVAVFLVGFGADTIKNLLSEK
jgi:hypothetical protein